MVEWVKDKVQPGLYKREREVGHVWAVKGRIKGGTVITVTIGKEEYFPISKARKVTKLILSQLAQGINPNQVKKHQQRINQMRKFSLQQALDEYSNIVQWKDSTRDDVYKVMNRRFSDWLRRPLASISKQECLSRFQDIKLAIKRNNRQKNRSSSNPIGEGESQKAFRYLGAIFNSFVHDDIGDEKLLPKGNPCSALKTKKVRKALKPRDRYLNKLQRSQLHNHLASVHSDELEGTFRTTKDDADLIWLLIHTGLRLEEALMLKWDDVDFANETFTAFDTKNNRDHTLPMTENTKIMLTRRINENNNFVFPSPIHSDRPMTASKTFRRVSDETGFIFTAHDLRRTVATVAAERGYDISSIGAVLNHSRQGVTEGYIQRTLPRLKQILMDIEEELF
ncbi:MAG: tyrosine-type recombinase/integrase [Gammaproteobacteria bacterium]|jgi:integrase|nr:tyrosine-type recombinase/integrase [Gammaproteobacteria bacterium]